MKKRSGLNVNDPYCCGAGFFLSACTYVPMGRSLLYVDRRREDSDLVYKWLCMIFEHHPQMDRCSTTFPFWDIPEGQW
jgi:hypothetical protein